MIIYGGEYYITEDKRRTDLKKRFSFPINELWDLNFNNCLNNCNNNGKCEFGRCVCDKEFFGVDCKNKLCKNSFCILDPDDWSKELCFHCSGHGKKKINISL